MLLLGCVGNLLGGEVASVQRTILCCSLDDQILEMSGRKLLSRASGVTDLAGGRATSEVVGGH